MRLVTAFAGASLTATEPVLAQSISQATKVSQALAGFHWDRLRPLITAADQDSPRGREAARILAELRKAVAADEFTIQLPSALRLADQAIFDWLADGQPPPPPPPPSRVVPPTGRAVRASGGRSDAVVAALRLFLEEHPSVEVTVEWRVTG